MQSVFEVVLSDHRYPVHTGRGYAPVIAAEVAKLKAAGRPLALIVDASVEDAQMSWIEEAFRALPCLTVPAGEGSKCFAGLERCCDFLAENRIDRLGALFAMGGGVTGDLAGFAAASYLRGIDFYQVPTTLLAMVDSSVGGKTGINLKSGKNLVGAFHQPQAVFADMELLGSLPSREFSAGMAEVIKHGMLADKALFERLENLPEPLHPQHEELASIVRRNCEIKAGIVQADAKEEAAMGGRALLNLGHTFGHAIEAVAGYGEYLHGEAIAIGLRLAASLSVELGFIEEPVVDRSVNLLQAYRLPVSLRAPLLKADLLAKMASDKKVRAGRLKFVVMKALGQAATQEDVPESLIAELWETVGAV